MNTLERVRADLELGVECGVAHVDTADLSALLRAVDAARGLADWCRSALDAGPITKGPSKEAYHWRNVRAALNDLEKDTP